MLKLQLNSLVAFNNLQHHFIVNHENLFSSSNHLEVQISSNTDAGAERT